MAGQETFGRRKWHGRETIAIYTSSLALADIGKWGGPFGSVFVGKLTTKAPRTAEVTFRFGTQSRRRRRLILRLRRWIELGRAIGALRLLVDGSFVTNKLEPGDVDAVMFLPDNFADLVTHGLEAAVELEQLFLTRHPEELFPAEDEAMWQGWCEFFSRTREPDRRRKGLVEIVL